MRKRLFIFYAILVFTGALYAEETSHPMDQEAVLSIQITNGTKGGQVPENTPVTVLFYHDDHMVKKESLETDSTGKCEIQGVPTGAGVIAVAQAKHSNMAFSSVPLALEGGKKQYDMTFQVFDVVYDNSLIHVGTHHIILKKSGSNIHVTEYIQLINDSDKAILSDDKDADENAKVVEISLPKSFKDLTFASYFHSDAVVQTETGFYDTMAIPPGSYHGVYSYNVPLSVDPIDFSKTITLPTKSVMVFVEANSGIESDLGEPAGQMTLKDGTNTNYYTVDVSSGSVFTFHAEGIPAPPSQDNIWIILSVVFGLVVFIALLRFIKNPSKA